MSAKQNGRVFCSFIETNFKDLKQDDWKNDLEFGNKNKDVLSLEDNHGEVISSSKAKSVEFVYAKYDDLAAFKKTAVKELWKTKSRLNEIFDVCDHIEKSIDQSKSIAINLKTYQSMVMTSFIVYHQENLQSANYAVICKFVHRMTKEKIIAASS